jgi:Zn-dependent peptidase ImmA (M78 family)
MKLLAHTIRFHFPEWNKRVLIEDEVIDFCRSPGAVILETDLIDDLGEYRVHRDVQPFILIHKFIARRYRLWVLMHEAAHFILHPTAYAKFSDSNLRRKIEKEANFFAAVALIPQYLLRTKTLCEIEDEFGYLRQMIMLRKRIFDTYKI